MQWFGGSVAEAVALSKQRNAIFVVFIEGDNDLSVEMATTIDDAEVVKRLTDPANFLAIKLQSGSEHYTHFAQIYQFVPVPSLFFIGRNGTPLEVVCAGVDPANLAARIDRILQAHHTEKPLQASSSRDGKQQSSDLLQAESSNAQTAARHTKGDVDSGKQAEKTQQEEVPESSSGPSPPKVQKTEEYEVVCEGDVCRRVPKAMPEQAGPSVRSVVVDNRVEVSNVLPTPPTSSPPTPSPPTQSPTTQQPPTQAPTTQSPTTQQPPTQSPKTQQPPTQAPTTLTSPTQSPPTPTQAAASVDDKVEKAKELMEARRREKAAKEKELEIQKELERRAVGQGVTELKQWQAEQALKQIQEERKREKMENNLARQRILEQIAQDRAERRARDQAPLPATSTPAQAPSYGGLQQQLEQYRCERRAQAVPAVPPPVVSPPPTLGNTSPAPGDAPTQARIQFKLPDGSSHTAHFRPEDTLTEVHVYVSENLQLSQNNYSLWTAFPRRELTEPTATLLSLQLTPSAALLVLPRRQNREVTQPTQLSVIMTLLTQLFTQYILAPSRWVYNWVQARLFPATTGGNSPADEPHTDPTGPSVAPGNPSVRRRTNIHRLGEHQQDDDNNTWNGNSTQQM